MNVVFFGTPSFAANILIFLHQNDVNISAVVTQPDKIHGERKHISFVKKTAQINLPNIPIYQPIKASSLEFIEQIEKLKPDLIVVVAYGQILKQRLLDAPKLDCINVHGSLLPKYRGAAPIQRCLMAGEKKTGITIMKMVAKMDAGDMLLSKEVDIDDEMNFGELEQKLCEISGPMLLQVIQDYKQNKVFPTAQDESKVSFANKITHEDCIIDWNQPAKDIHNQIRALSPTPGARCTVAIDEETKWLKITKTKVTTLAGTPGKLLSFEKDRFIVACQKDALELLQVQLEGKKSMSSKEFICGMQKEISFLS